MTLCKTRTSMHTESVTSKGVYRDKHSTCVQVVDKINKSTTQLYNFITRNVNRSSYQPGKSRTCLFTFYSFKFIIEISKSYNHRTVKEVVFIAWHVIVKCSNLQNNPSPFTHT